MSPARLKIYSDHIHQAILEILEILGFSHRQDITLLHRTSRAGEVFAGSGASGGSGSGLPRFAFFTHYPGDVRKMDTEILLCLELYYGTSLVQHGSTCFNLYDGRCPHFGCETAVCTILVLLKMLASGQIWIRTVTMQIYDSYLLKALDVKLPYSEDSSTWSVGHCDADVTIAMEDEEPVFLPCGNQICVWVSKSNRCAGAGLGGHLAMLVVDVVVSP